MKLEVYKGCDQQTLENRVSSVFRIKNRVFACVGAAIILSLFSCSDKLTRAKKLIAKAEADGAVWSRDTVFVDTPVFIEEVKRDSIFFSLPGDTVRIEKDRLRVTYVRLPGDSVYIEGECKADTVYREIPVTITNTIETESGFAWWWLVLVGLGCIGLGRIFR